ncbi:hypothetical protein BY996DRAFT_6423429 [Phakopsora pachyrhizi]|nr:hypothetical protein BY996DRAFT_6423429 [Phakopsora pachyrhizi]
MFRAVFETAVERAEENPGLVDSEDVPLALLCHIATLSYLVIILFYLPNSPDQHNPLIDTVTPDNTQAGLLGGHWQEINTTLHPPPAVAGIFYLLLGRSAVIIVGIGSQPLLIIRRIFGSHLVIIIHLLIPSEENFALEKFKWHRAGLNQTINSFLHHHHHQTATVRGSTRAAGQGRGLGLSSSDAVVKATDLYSSAVLWGPDFKGWQSSTTLTKNIKNQFGSESYFDAVLVYFNNNQVKQPKTLSQQGDGVIIIVRSHEMRDMRKEEIYKSKLLISLTF